jgi:hypothetical protein
MGAGSEADILGYGGAAGGGKTDLLLGLAFNQHHRALILRREAAQLRDMIDRSTAIAPEGARFNGTLLSWRLDGARKVEFGGVKDAQDVAKWKGRPHDFLGFDEATEFSEGMVRFLMTWLRTTVAGQRRRAVLTFNPPTNAEGRWVLDFFAPWLDPKHHNPAKPGELRWYAQVDGQEVERPDGEPFEHGGKTIKPLSRTFIPARLADNPYLDNPEYRAMLDSLPEPLRSQMRDGDFRAGIEDDPWQIIPTEWVEAAQRRWSADGRPRNAHGEPMPLSAAGVDVARGGKDQTVIQKRYANWFPHPEAYPGTATPNGGAVAGLLAPVLAEGGYANIDVIGVGASAYDSCIGQSLDAHPVNFSTRVIAFDRTGTMKFANMRAYAYWSFREALDPEKGDDLALPPDADILADLTAPRWSMQLNGVQVEDKDDIKKRIHRSPDKGDAIVLSALPNMAPRVS